MLADEVREQCESLGKSGLWEAKWCRGTTFEEKFEAFIEQDFEKVIFAYPTSADPHSESKAWAEIRKRHDYNREQALLLLHVQEFRDRFLDFVRRWGLDMAWFQIDDARFYHDEPSGFNAWHLIIESISVEFHITHRERFAAVFRRLAEDYAADLDFRKLERRRRRVHRALALPRFWWEVEVLTHGSGLAPHWERSICGLALSGTLYVPRVNCRLVVREEALDTRVLIELFPDTTTADLEAKWKETMLVRSELLPEQFGRKRRRENLERDLHALRETERGRSFMEVVTEDLAPDDADEIPLAELGEHDAKLKERVRQGVARLKEALRDPGVQRPWTTMSSLVRRWSLHTLDIEHYF